MNLGYLALGPQFGDEAFGDGEVATTSEVPDIVGGIIAGADTTPHKGVINWSGVLTGVTTGALIHLVVRALDHVFGRKA